MRTYVCARVRGRRDFGAKRGAIVVASFCLLLTVSEFLYTGNVFSCSD